MSLFLQTGYLHMRRILQSVAKPQCRVALIWHTITSLLAEFPDNFHLNIRAEMNTYHLPVQPRLCLPLNIQWPDIEKTAAVPALFPALIINYLINYNYLKITKDHKII